MMKARCKCQYGYSGDLFGKSRLANFFSFFSSRPFFDRRMGYEIDGEVMGEDYKGYTFKITGGNDAQGFPMKQGIMRQGRVRILFKKSKW